jgi:hypothetical protein
MANPTPAPRTAAELMSRIAGFLARLGLEPEPGTEGGGIIRFAFLGSLHELELIDIDRRVDDSFTEWCFGHDA